MSKQHLPSSLLRIALTLTLGVGVTSVLLHFASMGHYPKTNDEQVIEALALWFGAVFIILTIVFTLLTIIPAKKNN